MKIEKYYLQCIAKKLVKKFIQLNMGGLSFGQIKNIHFYMIPICKMTSLV